MAIVVNGERIEDADIQQEAERMRPQFEQAFSDDDPEEREARLQEWARENAVEKTLLVQKAKADPKPVPPEDIDKAFEEMKGRFDSEEAFYEQLGTTPENDDAIKKDIELQLRMERLMERVSKKAAEPTDAEVESYYSENQDEFMAPEMVRVRHIVKHVSPGCDPESARTELVGVKQQLDQGADFAELAEQHSDCPDNGGDLGYFPRGHMVEEFEHLVFSMAKGQTSDVFPSRFGFHIVRLLDRKAPEPYELDQVRDHVKERLAEQLRNDAVEAFINGLRAEATIEEAPAD